MRHATGQELVQKDWASRKKLKEFDRGRAVIGEVATLGIDMGKTRSLSASLQHMSRVLRTEGTGPSDAELVRQFVEQRDEVAFCNLVWRYGVIVLGVCRRVL